MWLALALLIAASAHGQVLTGRTSNARTGTSGANILTPANVTANFRRLGSYAAGGYAVYAQPLVVNNITVNGVLRSRVLIVATMHNVVYAYNADLPGSPALWSRSVGTPRSSGLLVPFYGGEVGCVATPAVDLTLGQVFVVCHTVTAAFIASINLADGTVANSTTIAPTATGTGDPGTAHSDGETAATEVDLVSGGILSFYGKYQICRTNLAITDGKVFVGCGSSFDYHPWHGWVVAYTASTLAQAASWCASPNGWGSGVWAGGITVAQDGSIIAVTGNGGYDGVTEFGFSLLRFNTSLVLQDWYSIPAASLAAYISADIDLGSTPAITIGTSQLVIASKARNAAVIVRLFDLSCLGRQGGTVGACSAPQEITLTGTMPDNSHSGAYGLTFLPSLHTLYIPTTAGAMQALNFNGTTFDASPVQGATYAEPGAMAVASVQGAANGVVFALTTGASALLSAQTGVLRALNPATLAEYWNSGTLASDAMGQLAKFAVPTVDGGRVYVPTLAGVSVYGVATRSLITN